MNINYCKKLDLCTRDFPGNFMVKKVCQRFMVLLILHFSTSVMFFGGTTVVLCVILVLRFKVANN